LYGLSENSNRGKKRIVGAFLSFQAEPADARASAKILPYIIVFPINHGDS